MLGNGYVLDDVLYVCEKLTRVAGSRSVLVGAEVVMLEPLGVSVFNTVLSARPLAAKVSSSHSAFKMIARAKGASFPPDFFTPQPRNTKGKERAVVGEVYEVDLRMEESNKCSRVRESLKGEW